MRRECLGLLIICFLALPSVAEGQCRKRVLIYLDVSGSMMPVVQWPQDRPRSPYHQALSAVASLFEQEGFIEKNDFVRAVRFGKAVEQVDSAEGPEQVADLIQKLRGNEINRLETDFRAAFGDLARELPAGTFDRQVVLFASDLAHEPRNRMPSAEAVADWRIALSQALNDLPGMFASENATMVLFRPEARGRDPQETARAVAADIKANFPVSGEVGSGAGAAAVADLTNTLRTGLLSPPAFKVSRDSAEEGRLVFTVTNDNCIPLHVKRITVEPEGGQPFYFDDFSEEEREIGERKTSRRTREIRRPVPPGSEWQEARLEATLETDEGVQATSAGTTGSWLKYKAASAVFERRPLASDVLRLDLDMTGFADPSKATIYRLTFGDDASPMAQGRFEAPALSSTETRHYRVVLPLKTAGQEAADVRVSIEGAEVLSEAGDLRNLVEDDQATHFNRVFGSVALVAVLGVVFIFLWVRSARSSYRIFQFSRFDSFQWGLAAVVAALLAVLFYFRIAILNRLSPETAEHWLSVLACVSVFGLTAFVLLEVARTVFARRVVGGAPLPLKNYLRQGRLDTLVPWTTGLLLAVLVFALLWPLRPAGSPESQRSDDQAHTRLHVTSD